MTLAPNSHPGICRLVIADDRARTGRALGAVLATNSKLQLVDEAADGEEALAAIERLQPDIVIIDIRMPRLNGVAGPRCRVRSSWGEIATSCWTHRASASTGLGELAQAEPGVQPRPPGGLASRFHR